MPSDATKHDAAYPAFAARMLAALAAEEAEIAALNSTMTKYQSPTTDTTSETVRPTK
jgi:hypothetical protein